MQSVFVILLDTGNQDAGTFWFYLPWAKNWPVLLLCFQGTIWTTGTFINNIFYAYYYYFFFISCLFMCCRFPCSILLRLCAKNICWHSLHWISIWGHVSLPSLNSCNYCFRTNTIFSLWLFCLTTSRIKFTIFKVCDL